MNGKKRSIDGSQERPLFLLSAVFFSPYLGVRGLLRGLAGDVALERPLGAVVSFLPFVVVIVTKSMGNTGRSDWLPLVAVVAAAAAASFRLQAQAVLDPLLADEHRFKSMKG